MTAIPNDVQLDEPARRGGTARPGLPRPANVFLLAIIATTVAATAPFYANLLGGADLDGWGTFAVLAIAAAFTQLFVVRVGSNHSYHTSVVFLIAAALLLPPELVVLIGIVQNVPEWLKERYPWYIQGFNICNYTLNTLAAWGAARLVHRADGLIPSEDIRMAVCGLVACVVFVSLNHTLLALMLRFARGRAFRETGLFSVESISVDLALTALGVALATFWLSNPWLIPIAVAPLLVVHRSLRIPQLQAEARIDSKTGLYNTRYFGSALAAELSRATRFQRPLSLIMVDLDLLRDINNTYGHLAGDAVLRGIAAIFRAQLRHYDVPSRFGGEEFSILLPETPREQAIEIAERIRRAVAEHEFEVETASEPIRATVSIGVATFPHDAGDANELIHQADLAVYRAKLHGRNRVLGASADGAVPRSERPRAAELAATREASRERQPERASQPRRERPHHPRPHALQGPRFLSLSRRLSGLVGGVSIVGVAAGLAGAIFGPSIDPWALVAVVGLVGVGQALALEVADHGSLSLSAVGILAGAALFGPRAALALAVTTCAVEWSARRTPLHTVLFNVGTLSLASLAAATAFAGADTNPFLLAALGLVAGTAYFAVNMGLVALAVATEAHERWLAVFREQFAWLAPHYLVYGFLGGTIAVAYDALGLLGLGVFAVPLLLMRRTQEAYLAHTQRSAQKLREAAGTIQEQNLSLAEANALLRERSTAAMESLSATVDARDSYTAGHSRRVQQLALAVGRELALSPAELDLLGHAALFHDIGKLAIPDAILLKPASLTEDEWTLMQTHAEEGARIIDRLGFLDEAVPAIRHHHERWDGTGYPAGLSGEEIPLGARIIHVADAFDSMVTTRIYRPALSVDEALAELRERAATQFCPRCVDALVDVIDASERPIPAPARTALAAS